MTSDQGGLWDKELEAPELEQALIDWLAAKEDRTKVNAITKAKKEAFDAAVKEFKLRPGQRVRVGSVHLTVSERSVEEDVVTPAYTATTAIDIGILDHA